MSATPAVILLVEDDPGTLALARRRLEEAGHRVLAAASARAALQLVQQHRVDLILLDNRLPGESGLDFYRQLRSNGLDVPAILMTGFASEDTIIDALRAGMRDFIPKGPQLLDYLPQAVARVLRQVAVEQKLAREQAARVEAEAASRAKDVFLATLSHELRTPLHTISGWVSLLRAGKVSSEDVPRALETIERNVQHQAELIEDLLDVSRIISGKLQLERAPLDLPALARELVEAQQHEAAAQGMRLGLEAAGGLPPVSADRKRLKQVLSNLLGNALKFTPAGGAVTVRIERAGDTVTLAVSDTGRGIEPELLPRIFEPFSQGEAGYKLGLGLGLSIARHIVEAHGGTIRAESAGAGHGTTVTLGLPALAQAGATKAPRPSAAAAPVEGAAAVEGLRVLLVDDDADSRELVRFALAARRAEVQLAGSVREALAVLEWFRADLVISDIAMPGGDGYQLLGALRKKHAGGAHAVPAVAFTAHASKQDRERALQAGFEAYVAKPVDPFELLELVSRVHRSHGRGASLS